MCLLSLFENDKDRRIAISIFAIEKSYSFWCISLFEDVFFGVSGFTYYILMAIFDFIVIATLGNLTFTPKIVIILQRICLASIVANLIAWTCTYLKMVHAEVYNLFYLLLYGVSIILIIKKEENNDRDHRLDLWAGHLRFINSQSVDDYR